MKKKNLWLCLGLSIALLCGCGNSEGADSSTDQVAEATMETETEETEIKKEANEETAQEASDTKDAASSVVDLTANATQVVLDAKTAYSDIGEYFAVELYYPNHANLAVEKSHENVVEFTCEEDDFVLTLRALEDSTFKNNWESDKKKEGYSEIDFNGYTAYVYPKTMGYSDQFNLMVQLESIGESTDRYLSVVIQESYAGDHASGTELYENNETIKHILASIQYLGNTEKTTMAEGVLTFEGKTSDMILQDPSAYLATDHSDMTWKCEVKSGYIYISAKDQADAGYFYSTSIRKDNAADLTAWKDNILKYTPDRVVESTTIGDYEVMYYISEESDTEIDCTHAMVKDNEVITFSSYASNLTLVEEYISAMLDHMEIKAK